MFADHKTAQVQRRLAGDQADKVVAGSHKSEVAILCLHTIAETDFAAISSDKLTTYKNNDKHPEKYNMIQRYCIMVLQRLVFHQKWLCLKERRNVMHEKGERGRRQ